MQSIQEIIDRNVRVELDKAWETSKTRRACIAGATYLIAVLFMWRIGVSEPFFNALVPTGGYLLSTLSLPFLKKWWIKKNQFSLQSPYREVNKSTQTKTTNELDN